MDQPLTTTRRWEDGEAAVITDSVSPERFALCQVLLRASRIVTANLQNNVASPILQVGRQVQLAPDKTWRQDIN